MVKIEIIGAAIAEAIKATGKYRAEEQKTAMALVAKESDADDLVDNLSRLGNISADRQELEKSGIIAGKPHEASALAQQVRAALAKNGVAMPIKAS